MTSFCNPSKRLAEWVAAVLSPYIQLEGAGSDDRAGCSSDGNNNSSSSQLSLGIWSGILHLNNVKLNPEAFEKFLNSPSSSYNYKSANDDIGAFNKYGTKVRWKLIQGTIESIHVSIPWKSLLVGSMYSKTKDNGPSLHQEQVQLKHMKKGDSDIAASKTRDSSNCKSREKNNETGDFSKSIFAHSSCINHIAMTEMEEKSNVLQNDEEANSDVKGCTIVSIKGIRLVLAYEIIRQNFTEEADEEQNFSCDQIIDGKFQEQLREEKKRMIQIAERRLLSGLDPFPPSLQQSMLYDEQTIMQSSIEQSPSYAASTSSVRAKAEKTSTISKEKHSETPKKYLSKIEEYLTSTMKSLLWRTFNSLSLSVMHVRVSVIGYSHYDKDFIRSMQTKAPPHHDKGYTDTISQTHWRSYQNQNQCPLQRDHLLGLGSKSLVQCIDIDNRKTVSSYGTIRNMDVKVGINSREQLSRSNSIGRGSKPNLKNYIPRVRSWSSDELDRRIESHCFQSDSCHDGKNHNSMPRPAENKLKNLSNFSKAQKVKVYQVKDDLSKWPLEGYIELGLTFEQFDVRSSLSFKSREVGKFVEDGGGDWGPSSLKHLQLKSLGFFLRRGTMPLLEREDCESDLGDRTIHRGIELKASAIVQSSALNNLETDDYVFTPTNIDAYCRFYRYSPVDYAGEAETSVTCRSSIHRIAKKVTMAASVDKDFTTLDDTSNINITNSSESHQTFGSKRRSKRDKKTKDSLISGSLSNLIPPSMQPPSNHSLAETLNSPSTYSFFPVQHVSKPFLEARKFDTSNSLGQKLDKNIEQSLPPSQIEMSWNIGHINIIFSARHFFLLHSFLTSLSRLKKGRPLTTIRAALFHDRNFIERLSEEGHPRTARGALSQIFPSLRSSKFACQTLRTLPHVVLSWWRYAYINVVIEINERKLLLDECSAKSKDDKKSAKSTGRINFRIHRRWNSENQSRIRQDYIKLYLLVNDPPQEESNSEKPKCRETSNHASLATAEMRLKELEACLSVERIILLRFVSRAAHDLSQIDKNSTSSANKYFIFPSRASKGQISWQSSQHVTEVTTQRIISPIPLFSSESVALAQSSKHAFINSGSKVDEGEYDFRDTALEKSSIKTYVSYGGTIYVSGISFALCVFDLGNQTYDEMKYTVDWDDPSTSMDDISALTGFSDSVDSPSKKQKYQNCMSEKFKPLSRFWSTNRHKLQLEPIALVHVLDINLSARYSQQECSKYSKSCKISVGGISIQGDGSVTSKKILLNIGDTFDFDSGKKSIISLLAPTTVKDAICASPCFTYLSRSSDQERTSATDIEITTLSLNVDWSWLNTLSIFLSVNKDIERKRLIQQLKNAEKLIKAFSQRNDADTYAVHLKVYKISVNIPVPSIDTKLAKMFVITLASLQGNFRKINFDTDESDSNILCALESIKSHDQGGVEPLLSISSPINCINHASSKVVTLDRLDIKMISQESVLIVNTCGSDIPFLCTPMSIHYNFDAENSQSTVVILSPIHLMISEIRLRAMVETFNKIYATFCYFSTSMAEEFLFLPLPAVDNLILEKTQIIVQSLGVHVFSDIEEIYTFGDIPHDSTQHRLKDIVRDYISLLSCLDFYYPSQNAISCIATLSLDKCYALGLSVQDAQDCLNSAQQYFRATYVEIFDLSHDVPETQKYQHLRPMKLGLVSDTMSRIVSTATEKTVADFNHLLLHVPNVSLFPIKHVCIDANLFTVNLSKFYSGCSVKVTTSKFSMKTGHGINLLTIHQDNEISEESINPSAIVLTINVKLSNECDQNNSQGIIFAIGGVDATFLPEAYLETFTTCHNLINSVSLAMRSTRSISTNTTESVQINSSVRGSISFATLIVADKCIPFIKICLHKILIKQRNDKDVRNLSVSSQSISLERVSPLGAETYPDIVITYHSDSKSNEKPAFFIDLSSTTDRFEHYNTLILCLHNVRILLLQEFCSEILQFTLCPKYGIGLLSTLFEERKQDTTGSFLPEYLKLQIKNSSIVFPRDSNSIDLLSFEIEEFNVTPSIVEESWSVEGYSFQRGGVSDAEGATANVEKEKECGNFLTKDPSLDVFFDCFDGEQSNGASSPLEVPGITTIPMTLEFTESPNIPRITAHLSGIRIFTAINLHHFSLGTVHMPLWNKCVFSTGRAKGDKLAFERIGSIDHSLTMEIQSRIWKEVTVEPISLDINADWTPSMRVLLESNAHGNKIAFDMKMSQFYMILSVWYSNMRQMPLLFPYEMEFIKMSSLYPEPPSNWPEYGTDEFVTRLQNNFEICTFEMSLCIRDLRWKCSYDHSMYFVKNSSSASMTGHDYISLKLDCALCSISRDKDSVIRVGLGATTLKISDGRVNMIPVVQEAVIHDTNKKGSFVNPNWGLECGHHTLISELPLPFQVTVFITPDKHCMINVGAHKLETTFIDLTPIWILLDYFGLYFKDSAYGHPSFLAEKTISKNFGCMNTSHSNNLDIDFRLWLTDPQFLISSTAGGLSEICAMLETIGFHYRYKSYGSNYSSHHIVVADLAIVILNEYMKPSISRGIRQVSGSLDDVGAKTLIDALSFSIQYDYDASTNFIRFSARTPLSSKHFERTAMNGIESPDVDVKPLFVPAPVVCKPFVSPSRNQGNKETIIYLNFDYMRLISKLLTAFLGHRAEENVKNSTETECFFSAIAHVENVKFIISDPVMGMYRPIMSICVPSLQLTASQLYDIEQSSNRKLVSSVFQGVHSSTLDNINDMQASFEATLFLDYFKLGATRSWEPFIEPFRCLVLYEKTTARGKGVTLNIDCPIHINISGALIETIDDAMDTFELFWSSCFRKCNTKKQYGFIATNMRCSSKCQNLAKKRINISHTEAEGIDESERRAFSLKNNTGQQIRVHSLSFFEAGSSSCNTTVYYLCNLQTMSLSFPATSTVIKNLNPIEAPIGGDRIGLTSSLENDAIANNHLIDIQIPGFKWSRGISIEETGRRFIDLIPCSFQVQTKINRDWRLKNGLKLLADVQCLNGGRRLSLHSPFEVINMTDHTISLAVGPDPLEPPQSHSHPVFTTIDEYESFEKDVVTRDDIHHMKEVLPDETFIVPFLLLESALKKDGAHLGSIWIRPKPGQFDGNLIQHPASCQNEPCQKHFYSVDIDFSSRPIQLAKMIHESADFFSKSKGNLDSSNQLASGVEISCPIIDKKRQRNSTPFCYVLEVKRSPIVRSIRPETIGAPIIGAWEALSPANIAQGLKNVKNKSVQSVSVNAEQHEPIFYSVIIHPPIVIQNLLPERGKFELMHARNRSVLWWGSLDPGEKVPIHTVGLDTPLLLLVNLGFCRTPTGEGALIHHGGGALLRTHWNLLGNAIKTSKERVKRTLHTVTENLVETKDTRGEKVMSVLKARFKERNKTVDKRHIGQLGFSTGEHDAIQHSEGFCLSDVGGHKVEDLASETTVIDSVGQRLTLYIDNNVGGGGQRCISLYCPYWIVNTTSHSLRYKQEKVSSFVCGTVSSPESDGSKPVDKSRRNEGNKPNFYESTDCEAKHLFNLSTIYSGTPGPLAIRNGHPLKPVAVAALISENLPLCILSRLAFMFNFQEVLSLGGPPKLCMQLVHTAGNLKHTSAWSSGFGLESVGVTQIVGMHCKDGRRLEVSVSISVAPGQLSNYTKIIRICPRYILVNRLPRSIRIWQDNSILHPPHTVEHSLHSHSEHPKWRYHNYHPDDTVNEYGSLFGEVALVDRCEENDINVETTAHHAACYITTVSPSGLVAFHLPDTRVDRLLRIDFGSYWNLSASFPVDQTGEHILAMTRVMDLRLLPHVSTRAAPIFTVTLPPEGVEWNGELGAWFETDWGRERSLIVKGIKEGSFASYFTDIVVGDELLSIDETLVETLTFEEAMKLLKVRLSLAKDALAERDQMISRPFQRRKKTTESQIADCDTIGVQLKFLTLEERLRRLCRKAVMGQSVSRIRESQPLLEIEHLENSTLQNENSADLLVDVRYLFQSMYIFVGESPGSNPPHRIINRSLQWAIFYRQRSCDSHPWNCLSPGESAAYTWEEPMKQKKLSVRVGSCEWSHFGEHDHKSPHKLTKKPIFSFNFIQNEEQGHYGISKTVKLEEIGYYDKLPCPERINLGVKLERFLHCHVDTEGTTRVLVVSDDIAGTHTDDESLIHHHLSNIQKEISEEKYRRAKLDALAKVVTSSNIASINSSHDYPINEVIDNRDIDCNLHSKGCHTNHAIEGIESELQDFIDYGEGQYITARHQVLEATGLISSDLNGFSNPYCIVSLKNNTSAFNNKESRSTYYVEKTLSPRWSQQIFVFDVPVKAAQDPKQTRHFSIRCVLKSYEKLRKDKFLGHIHIQLRDLLSQNECVGWYPLVSKLGHHGFESADRVRGSLRIRLQYIFNYSGLLNYYCLCSDRHIDTLRKSKTGMQRQLKALHEATRQREITRESSFLAGVPSLAVIHKRKRRPPLTSNHDLEEIVKQDETRIQPSKIIQSLRDTSENKLKKSIDRARSIIVNKRRQKKSYTDSTEHHEKHPTTANRMEGILRDDIDNFKEIDSCTSSIKILNDGSWDQETLLQADRTFLSFTAASSDLDSTGDACKITQTLNLVNQTNQTSLQIMSLSRRCLHYRLNEFVDSQFFSLTSWNLAYAFYNASVTQRSNTTSRKQVTEKFEFVLDDISPIEFFKLPSCAPNIIVERGNSHLHELMLSRSLFSKAARRSLGSVCNPGGVFTIRPITALNLPNEYTKMFVKIRFGDTICVSETVDSRVVPVWTDEETYKSSSVTWSDCKYKDTSNKRNKMVFSIKQRSHVETGVSKLTDLADIFNAPAHWGRSEHNDIHIRVKPFETLKSLHLSVIGENKQALQSKVELGVLEIPLGSALECYAQSLEDFEEDRHSAKPQGLPPAYVRWFPLISPSDAIPIEGDMGQSFRPKESEKRDDNMFREYFTPCIKLALMFKPDTVDAEKERFPAPSIEQYMYAKLDRLSVALIDSTRVMEILSFSSRDTDLRLSITKTKTRLTFSVENAQVDQQRTTQEFRAPIVLAATPMEHPQPLIQFLVWKDNTRSKIDVDYLEYFALQVQEMDLKIEDSWLFDVWEFYLDTVKRHETRLKSRGKNIPLKTSFTKMSSICSGENKAAVDVTLKAASDFLSCKLHEEKKKKIYIRELTLGYMKVNLSYFKSPRSMWASEISRNQLVYSAHSGLYVSPNLLSQRISTQSNSDDAFKLWSENILSEDTFESSPYNIINLISAPIRFQRKLIEHIFESKDDILRSLRSYYSSEALKQIYKIVGSLDFVGNPTMVLTSFRTGIRDFILQPSRELKHLRKKPQLVGFGMIKGSLSLFSNSTSGIFGFASNLGSSFGNSATMLTCDEHFKQLHFEKQAAQQRYYDQWRKTGLGHATLIISRPVHDLAFGILSATTGLITEPYRGAIDSGAYGFSKGVMIGMVGVVIKPIVGISDAFSHIMGSVHDIAKCVNILEAKINTIERYRLPCVFGLCKMLLPYDKVLSRSAQLLILHPVNKKSKRVEETIITSQALHMDQGLEQYIIVTTNRIALFKMKASDGQRAIIINLEWQVCFEKDLLISSSLGSIGHNGSTLYVSQCKAESYKDDDHCSFADRDDTSDKFFPSQDNNLDRNSDVSHTPKYFYLGNKLRNPWPFAVADNDRVKHFIVEGDSSHQLQLLNVHNAICCVSKDFDSVLYDSQCDISERFISFGNLIFQKLENCADVKMLKNDLNYLNSCIEDTSWQCIGSHDGSIKGPSWLNEACAHAMYAQKPFLLPSNIDPVNDQYVSKLLSELEEGLLTSTSVEEKIYGYARSLNFQKIKKELINNDLFHYNSSRYQIESHLHISTPSSKDLVSKVKSSLSKDVNDVIKALHLTSECTIDQESSSEKNSHAIFENSLADDERCTKIELNKAKQDDNSYKQSFNFNAPYQNSSLSALNKNDSLESRLCQVEAMLDMLIKQSLHFHETESATLITPDLIDMTCKSFDMIQGNPSSSLISKNDDVEQFHSKGNSSYNVLLKEIIDLKELLLAKNSPKLEVSATREESHDEISFIPSDREPKHCIDGSIQLLKRNDH